MPKIEKTEEEWRTELGPGSRFSVLLPLAG